MRNNRSPFVALLISSVFIWHGWGQYSKSSSTSKWPTAQGTIVESEVAEIQVRSGTSTSRLYEPRVVYEYEAAGKKITGDRIAYVQESSSHRSSAAKVVGDFSVGKVVPVYYNPADPYDAYLSTKGSNMPWLMLGMGILGFGFSLKNLVFGNFTQMRRGVGLG